MQESLQIRTGNGAERSAPPAPPQICTGNGAESPQVPSVAIHTHTQRQIRKMYNWIYMQESLQISSGNEAESSSTSSVANENGEGGPSSPTALVQVLLLRAARLLHFGNSKNSQKNLVRTLRRGRNREH